MLEIPDIFFFGGGGGGGGVRVDAGPEPTYEEKLRVPTPPGIRPSNLAVTSCRQH